MKQFRPLDTYDVLPEDMRKYISFYGFHFNKKACDYAVSLMRKKNAVSGKEEAIEAWSKEQVEDLLKRNSIKLENCNGYDYVYVANMAKAGFYKSSLEDEAHLAKYVKDVVDDIDDNPENVFRCWLSKMVGNGVTFDWYDLL